MFKSLTTFWTAFTGDILVFGTESGHAAVAVVLHYSAISSVAHARRTHCVAHIVGPIVLVDLSVFFTLVSRYGWPCNPN